MTWDVIGLPLWVGGEDVLADFAESIYGFFDMWKLVFFEEHNGGGWLNRPGSEVVAGWVTGTVAEPFRAMWGSNGLWFTLSGSSSYFSSPVGHSARLISLARTRNYPR